MLEEGSVAVESEGPESVAMDEPEGVDAPSGDEKDGSAVGEDDWPQVSSGNFGENELSLAVSVCVRVSDVMPAGSPGPQEDDAGAVDEDSSPEWGDDASVGYPPSPGMNTSDELEPASSDPGSFVWEVPQLRLNSSEARMGR